MTAFEVFLSHSVSQDDLPIVEDLKKRARAFGITIYTAERDVQPGSNLTAKITTAIQRSDVVVALLTTNGASSAWVNQEVGYALSSGKLVVPLVEEGVSAPAMLVGKEHVRFRRDAPHVALDRVERFLKRLKADKEFRQSVEIVAIAGLVAVFVLLIILVLTSGS